MNLNSKVSDYNEIPKRDKVYTIALTGNPNVGKSALFNSLTGGEVFVANWPGVTVELKYGKLIHHGINIQVVDLPGSYSLVMGDEAEKTVRDYLLNNKPDLYVIITDITALERTLYPAIKLMEAYPHVIIVMNMADIARRRALHVDKDALENELNTFIIETSALTGEGIGVLLDRIVEYLISKRRRGFLKIDYGPLEPYIHKLEQHIKERSPDLHLSHRWIALELLEGDEELKAILIEKFHLDKAFVSSVIEEVKEHLRIDIPLYIIQTRYNFITNILKGRIIETKLIRPTWMIKLDNIFLKPIVGPIFSLIILFLSFLCIFIINTGFPLNVIFHNLGLHEPANLIESYSLVELVSLLFGQLSTYTSNLLSALGIPDPYISFITDGVLGGIGAVLSFLPLVFLVFVLSAFLQDTGLYTRIAVSFHNFLKRYGLSGKSIYPIVVGFGCNVPAVLSTRALDDDRERITVALAVPFIPCQARLVVMLAIAAAISRDPIAQAAIITSLYIVSIIIYLITSKILTKGLFKMKSGPELLLELPPYHIPHIRVLWWYSKFNTMAFLKKAGTIILLLSMLIWILLHTGPHGYIPVEEPKLISDSFAAILGKFLLPLMAPIGIADWRAILSLEIGFIAKEAIISTLVTITGFDDPVKAFNAIGLSSAQLYLLAIFMTIYTPCLATIVSMKSEVGKWKLVLIIIGYQLLLAYLITLIVSIILMFLP